MAPVDAVVREVLVIPNLGGPPNGYFEVLPRRRWRKALLEWFRDDLEDHISDCSTEPDAEPAQNYQSGGETDAESIESDSDLSDSSEDGI